MSESQIPILIVDEAQFANTVILEILTMAEYTNLQLCENATQALQKLEESPAHILIANLTLDDMDGIELARALRDIDSERNHYTYIILYAELQELDPSLLEHADCVFSKDNLVAQVAHQVQVGERVVSQLNSLKEENKTLRIRCEEMEKGQLLDPVTGLGNKKYAEQSLSDNLRQIESRGGAVCFLLIGIQNYNQIVDDFHERVAKELAVAISKRLLRLVRPLDLVSYIDPGHFAVILNQPSIEQCTADCYRRIYDGIRLNSYPTSAGFLDATIGMGICASEAQTGAPNPDTLMITAQDCLDLAYASGDIVVKHLIP